MANLTLSLTLLALALFVANAQGQCPRPLPIAFSTFSPDKTSYDESEVLSINCNNGYRNLGRGVATCQGGGWRVVGGRANIPRCVPRADRVAPTSVPRPVGPVVNVAVSCDAQCDLDNSRCVIYMGTRLCACKIGYFKHPTEGCVARQGNIRQAPAQCARVRCPADSTCGQYDRLGCFCNNGYFLYQSRMCIPLPPAVVVRTCARPNRANLLVTPAGKTTWNVGEQVVFSCASGYALAGQRISRCTATGAFSTIIPTCSPRVVVTTPPPAPVMCSNPPTPTNGYTMPPGKTMWRVNEVVTFQCRSGTREGSGTARCLPNGFFSSHNTVCRVIVTPTIRATCPQPVAPINGGINQQKAQWFEGDVVTYSCNTGFAASGTQQSVCQSSGQFSNPPPSCGSPVRCNIPVVPFGGSIDGRDDTERIVGDKVRYSCGVGYRLYGNQVLECLNTGIYNAPFPHCISQTPITNPVTQPPQPVTCVNPPVPTNGQVVGGGTVFFPNQVVTIECLPGYLLTGPATLTCQANGFFTSANHFCVALPTGPTGCPRPAAPTNGELLLQPNEVTKNAWLPGERVLFNCFPGFNLVGMETLLCREGGQYNGNVPVCLTTVNPTCPNLVLPSFAFVVTTKAGPWEAGDTIEIGCELGFEPSRQPATFLCQSNGEYSADVPTCMLMGVRDNTCSVTRPQSGLVIGGKTSASPGEVVEFACAIGYRLVGESRAVCQFDGTLSDPEPSCEAMTTTPTQPLTCMNPEVPANAFTVPRGKTVWQPTELIIYDCNPGYELVSIPTRFCQQDGQIFGDVPECRAVTTATTITDSTVVTPTCKNPEVPANGLLLPQGKTEWQGNELITYDCVEGYNLEGVGLRFCQPDGQIFGDVPSCVQTPPTGNEGDTGFPDGNNDAQKCSPPAPANGYISPRDQTEFDVGVIFVFNCNEGYEVEGIPRNMCVTSGMLAIDPATCKLIGS